VRIDDDFIPFDRVTCRYIYIYIYINIFIKTSTRITIADFQKVTHLPQVSTHSRIIYIYLFIYYPRSCECVHPGVHPFSISREPRREGRICDNKQQVAMALQALYDILLLLLHISIYNIIVYTYIYCIQFILVVAVNTKYIRPK